MSQSQNEADLHPGVEDAEDGMEGVHASEGLLYTPANSGSHGNGMSVSLHEALLHGGNEDEDEEVDADFELEVGDDGDDDDDDDDDDDEDNDFDQEDEDDDENEDDDDGMIAGDHFHDYDYEMDEEGEDEDDAEFHDAEADVDADDDGDGGGEPRIHFRVVLGNGETQDAATDRFIELLRVGQSAGILSRTGLLRLLRSNGVHMDTGPKDPNRFPKVPSEEGAKLMSSGLFGANDDRVPRKKQVAKLLLDRELGIGNREERTRTNQLLAQSMIPGTKPDQIIHYDSPVYSGQFSDDGNFFYSCCQDFNVRIYDTSNPYQWKHYKTANYPFGHWTLTDASLSPDNKWLAYTSIQSSVSITPTDTLDMGDPYSLDLDDGRGPRRRSWWQSNGSFGIWSIRFSGDGRELVAGTSANSLVVYDIESRTVLHHIQGHDDDVNAVCFADKASPHIVYSGSDDAVIKVWDRRCMADNREVGAFVGHIEGLTYIDSKGDGRYILSNGKEQSMKLWDLRMAMSTSRLAEANTGLSSRLGQFDYRNESYDEDDWFVHPHDNSIVTFRGHKVLRTLIRCHFSPPSSTNSRYVYSGSTDGKVYVWNMDATIAGVIDVKKATRGTRTGDRPRRLYLDRAHSDGWSTCVRDASWHPNAPIIVASAWNGYGRARGTCTSHSFRDSEADESDASIGQSVDALLKPDPEFLLPTPV